MWFELRQKFCRHDWAFLAVKVEGVTLSWAGKPTRQFGFEYECKKCESKRYIGGKVIFNDETINIQFYDKDGWPINEQGTKLPVAELG